MPPHVHESRRCFVTLGVGGSGAIWKSDQKLQRLVTAYELTCLRRLSPNAVLESDSSREGRIGHELMDLVRGDVVYAFYAKSTHRVKIGRTTNLPDRWRRIEMASGALSQLLSVWHCGNSRELEAKLFARYGDHRTVGEWFTPEPIVADLKSWSAQKRWSLDLKETR
jgi:hypothetical protein